MRCAPQVAGAGRDTLAHARTVAGYELASAVDNPVVTLDGRVESNGNFHGAPVGYVLDFLAIAVADLASIAERRTDRLLDVARSRGLPPFLTDDAGVDSGHMIAQYTQAAIVSELKRLAVPASVDSIPSSAMQEDHVSMGWSAARKLRRSIDGLRRVLAIELLSAARALDLRAPLQPGPATGAVLAALREQVEGPGPDRFLAPEIEASYQLIASGRAVAAAESQLAAPLDLRPVASCIVRPELRFGRRSRVRAAQCRSRPRAATGRWRRPVRAARPAGRRARPPAASRSRRRTGPASWPASGGRPG